MRRTGVVACAIAGFALGSAACGDGTIATVDAPPGTVDVDGGDGGADGGVDEVEESPWTDLPFPMISVDGGSAGVAAGTGRDGGVLRLSAAGALRLDPGIPVPALPAIPVVPAGGLVLDDEELASDLTHDGTIRIAGEVTTAGSGGTRTITSTGGDIVVDGLLRAGDLGGAAQGIVLHAPTGTIVVHGAIVSRAADGVADGDAAGAITLRARQIVVTGHLIARGERDADGAGGAGGAITLDATGGDVLARHASIVAAGGRGARQGGAGGAMTVAANGAIALGGTITLSGGDAVGAEAATGGDAGDLWLTADGDIVLRADLYLRGGAAQSDAAAASGGAAGTLHVDTVGVATLADLVDARGAPALGATATGGDAGEVRVGDAARPSEIRVLVPLSARGGAGADVGGTGGSVTLQPAAGDLVVATWLAADGGASRVDPGDGGTIVAEVGDDAGEIRITGTLGAIGGNASASGLAATGGAGGTIDLQVHTHEGGLTVEASGQVVVDGGTSTGSGHAGGGGYLDFFTRDGDVSVAGGLYARGGAALEAGGTGGDGGPLYIHSDTDFDGIGGNVTIHPTGVIDVSGGAGTTGGSARNNFDSGVEYFPDGRHQIAVLLNSDTAPGELTDGRILNLGVVIARGAAGAGWGGDVVYHGRRPEGDVDPEPGQIILDGDGHDGEWFMQ